MSTKLEIQWTPKGNRFITWGSEICLYEVESYRENIHPTIRLSNTSGANLIATNNSFHSMKCVDIYPKSENDILLAVGNTSGRLVISSFGPSVYDLHGLTGKEFVPRHARQVNSLSWNTIDTNLIAVGLDKFKTDYAVLLWDIMKYPVLHDNHSGRILVNMQPAVELAKPVGELGLNEVAHSLAWFSSSSRQLAVGMNGRNIKVVDFRDNNKVVASTLTKAVYGICVDPHNEKHLASFIDNQLCVWDARSFEKPILTFNHSKPLLKIAWSPTKYNLLGSLQKETSSISLFDIQHSVVGTEEIEPLALERSVTPGSNHNITSFSWHHSDENRFLTIALSGSLIDYTVFDRITLNWASTFNITWTYGCKTMKNIKDHSLGDISNKIMLRAKSDYGLKEEIYKNGELVDSIMLSNVWSWLYLSNKLVEDGTLRGQGTRHPGVQSVLKLDPMQNKSEMAMISWHEMGHKEAQARIFKHEDREKALHLCSWHFERDPKLLVEAVDQLEKDQNYTKAAAIAVFSFRIKLAIEILMRAPENENKKYLNIVAMSLAGFSNDCSSNWRHYCSMLHADLPDPYLRAIFAFLTAENYNYDGVLNETEIAVDDRVAFACIFLPDSKLHEYLKKLLDKLIDEGNLDGLLLTGNNHDGIKLLQKYLDHTGDIQSTALIAVRAFSHDMFTESIKLWIESYRNLLDTWQLWNERSKFDIMLSSYRPSEKPPQQVYVSCNFCGKSISACMQELNRRGPFSRMGGTANNVKMSSCPHCRKPLPRCAICLMHMGTTSGNVNGDVETNKIVEFSNWFTWCQSCRHGGHAQHIMNWFNEHSECPVTACTCRCISIDSCSNNNSNLFKV